MLVRLALRCWLVTAPICAHRGAGPCGVCPSEGRRAVLRAREAVAIRDLSVQARVSSVSAFFFCRAIPGHCFVPIPAPGSFAAPPFPPERNWQTRRTQQTETLEVAAGLEPAKPRPWYIALSEC